MSFKKPANNNNSNNKAGITPIAKSTLDSKSRLRETSSIRKSNTMRMVSSAHVSSSQRASSKPDYRQVVNSNAYRLAYVALEILRGGDTYVTNKKIITLN